MATCRSCGAWITWAITENGKKMPIEKQPGGNVIEIDRSEDDPIVRVVKPGMGTHVSHFATCPDAAKHRRR